MKRYSFVCMMILFALTVVTSAHARSKRLCSGENETLECLKENFSEMFETKYIQFEVIIGKAQVEAMSCKSVEKTAAYLDIASKIGDNQEVEEYFKDMLETKFLKKAPVCFLDAMLLADNSTKDVIFGKYLQKPIYIKKADVDSVLSQYKEDERYKEMLRLYFGK